MSKKNKRNAPKNGSSPANTDKSPTQSLKTKGNLMVSVALVLIATVAVSMLAIYVISKIPAVSTAIRSTNNGIFDLLKVGLAVTAGLGAAVGLTVAYRRQSVQERAHDFTLHQDKREETKYFSDRFKSASELLGSSEPATRVGGVYAMAALADDWPEHRQACIDVLCGYIRLDTRSDTGRTPGDIEVRRTVFAVIRQHLRSDVTENRWDGQIFNFERAHLEDFDLRGVCLDSSTLDFTGATFSEGRYQFNSSHLKNGAIKFHETTFENAMVDFRHSLVTGGQVEYCNAKLVSGVTDFSLARFREPGGGILLENTAIETHRFLVKNAVPKAKIMFINTPVPAETFDCEMKIVQAQPLGTESLRQFLMTAEDLSQDSNDNE